MLDKTEMKKGGSEGEGGGERAREGERVRERERARGGGERMHKV